MPNSITVCESFGLEWNSKSTHIPIHMTLKPLGVQMVTWTTHENTVAVRSIISRKNKVNDFITLYLHINLRFKVEAVLNYLTQIHSGS